MALTVEACRTRKKLKRMAVIVAAAIFAGLQFTGPARTNPPSDEAQALEAMTEVPAEVSTVFARACNDCHSNKTVWPWYTRVAPASWFTVGHVNDGRSELNFSEWGSYGERMKQSRLSAICAHVKQGTMPLASYALVHQGVMPSPDEVRMICGWTEKESRRLAAFAFEDR